MRRLHPYVRLGLLVAVLAGAVLVVRTSPAAAYFTQDRVMEFLQEPRGSVWAPMVFVLGYVTATAVALPGSILTIAGGAVFGFWWGALLNTLAANIGASAAFGVARGLGREGVQRLAGNRLEGLNRATVQHGFLGLLVLRLVPLVPFNALNFGSGLTAMRWRDYALATLPGILPGTLVYTFFADALVQGAMGASAEARNRLWIATGLFLLLILVPVTARRLRFRVAKDSSRRTT